MKNIVFIIHTEYHLIEAVSYILNEYHEEEYKPYVYRISLTDSHRLDRFSLQKEYIPAEFREIRYEYNYKFDRSFRNCLEEIVALSPDKLVIFDEGHYWFPYLLKKIKKKCGTTIVLAPDGTNVYYNDDLSFKYRFKYIVHSFQFNYTHHLLPPFIPVIKKHHYAYSSEIDELWMEYTTAFNNFYKRKVCKKPIYNTDLIRDVINRIFHYSCKEVNNKSVVLFDAPYSNDVIDHCVDLLKWMKLQYPHYNYLVKLHPHSSKYAIEAYKILNFVSFLPNTYPAELYIQNSRNSVFFSVHSTAMLSYNPSCHYFWTSPMVFDKKTNRNFTNPTDYIHEISSFDQISDILGD